MWTKISWNPVVGYTGRRGPCHKYSLAGAKSSAVDSPGRSSLLLLSIWYSISLTIPIPGWLQYWSRQQCVVLVSEYLCALTSAPRVPEWHTLSIDSPNRNSHWFMHRLLTIKIEQRSISLLNTSMPPEMVFWPLCPCTARFQDWFPKIVSFFCFWVSWVGHLVLANIVDGHD